MLHIEVSAEHKYSVQFTSSWEESLVEVVGDTPAVVITSKAIEALTSGFPKNWKVIYVPEGEAAKSPDVFVETLNFMAGLSLARDAMVIGIGGGATTDLAGFLAASYMRGIRWVAVPTSLAGMVDAAIGGKTGINLAAGKNLAGAFHSPISVIIDPRFLDTLPERDAKAGLAEVVKCGFIADEEILNLIERDWRSNLAELIYRSVAVKANVVSSDFKESFQRESLNYGHTLGHAIEKSSDYSLRHGECVSIGMIFAAELSAVVSGLSSSVVQRHRSILAGLALPISYQKQAWPKLVENMQHDKKKQGALIRFVTLENIGKVARYECTDNHLLEELFNEKIGE